MLEENRQLADGRRGLAGAARDGAVGSEEHVLGGRRAERRAKLVRPSVAEMDQLSRDRQRLAHVERDTDAYQLVDRNRSQHTTAGVANPAPTDVRHRSRLMNGRVWISDAPRRGQS